MTISPTVWLSEFVTNLQTADAQANPKVIGLANGNFLVVWEDDNDSTADGFATDIVGVIFNALGEPLTGSLYLNFPFGFSRAEKLESIAATPDGGFVVIYEFRSGDDGDLIFGIYDAVGSRTEQGFVVSDDSVNGITYDNASVAVASDGSFFVTYERDDGTNQDIVGKKISADGSTIGAEQVLRADGFSNGADLEDILDPQTVALDSGGFATVYSENDNNGGANERTIELLFSNADGTSSTLINNVSTPDGSPDSNPRVAELADGRILVAWQEAGDLRGRIFNDNGTESIAKFNITSNTNLSFTLMDVVALEDGGYVTVFRDDTDGRLFFVRGINGAQVGLTQFVQTDAEGVGGDITDASASLTTDGRILVSWHNGEIYTEIFDPRDSSIIDVEADDGQTTGRQTATTINGSSSDDIIYGVGGDDTIFGNDGHDIIDGGSGNDMMFGGIGNDTYYFDSTADSATENAGEGFDTVFVNFDLKANRLDWLNIE
ncbi:hypothetical protein, partial [Erythrobacter alti]|uniref:calcium-binding protein n=1 Tax=Erythrobacter alti TaxID=1896145 RepID=UPI0030F3DF2D